MANKLKLDLYKDEEKQTKFILHLVLTFRLMPETLAELLEKSVEDVNAMLFYNGVSNIGVNYLINHEFYDQELAKANFLNFYSVLTDALKRRDKDKITELLNFLYDKKAVDLAKNRKKGDVLTDADIETIVNYQLKYGLEHHAILNIFSLSKNYQKRIKVLFETNYELKRRYENLVMSTGGRR